MTILSLLLRNNFHFSNPELIHLSSHFPQIVNINEINAIWSKH